MKNPLLNIFKKPVLKNPPYKGSAISVVASLQEPASLQNLVEKLARREGSDRDFESLNYEWLPLSTSSLEGYALGDLILTEDKDQVNSLFDTCFLFTCTRERKQSYSLTWVSSLS
ncbi:MAG: hypothetical protein IT214_00445 [Chitinophagaceae bacterium]|jgi:uncharacterized protein YheU (UPF0270 family)|nr:hypothetical protein [Chitinophagaceae bacterium]OQY93665.1 MAG: hypothetical protein B6D37_11260 [Sphingobacteriales bacterium UTBCD1]